MTNLSKRVSATRETSYHYNQWDSGWLKGILYLLKIEFCHTCSEECMAFMGKPHQQMILSTNSMLAVVHSLLSEMAAVPLNKKKHKENRERIEQDIVRRLSGFEVQGAEQILRVIHDSYQIHITMGLGVADSVAIAYVKSLL